MMCARAAESGYTLPPIEVSGKASFDTLREESLVPPVSIPVENARSTLLDDLKWNTLFPLQNFGFPSGANGVSLGGRSIDDTQVTTIGVPLNQAIGGGADLSGFPAFLWSEARIAPTTTSAAFIQQSASGNLDLSPWTWSVLKPSMEPAAPSRLTLSWDRDLQTASIGTRKSDISILAGNTFGRQTGPAGSLSYRFLHKQNLTLHANVIGTDQQGEDPGSTQFPRPVGTEKTTRVIPSLMARFSGSEGLSVQTTLFGDIQRLQFQNSAFSSLDKTTSIGVENAISVDHTVFTVSARNTKFTNDQSGSYSEWPAHIGVTQGFDFASGINLKATGSTEYLSGFGFFPGGRISSGIPLKPGINLFLEAQALPKLPGIQDRLYVTPFFTGNPSVSPERVYAVVAGIEDRSSAIQTKSQIRAELRRNAILLTDDFSTVQNAGSAQFLGISENLRWSPFAFLRLSGDLMATHSRLEKNGKPFPRLPYLSAGGSLAFIPHDRVTLETQSKWMGRSNETDGSDLPAYLLLGEKIGFSASETLQITLGVDNLLDSRIEMIRGFPLPGRVAYASLEMKF